MKRLIIICLLLPLLAFSSDRTTSNIMNKREQLFKQGISAYANENYVLAIELFHQLETEQIVSWELYYNLGNCYYRQSELGRAIQYWEKAKILAPIHSDIEYNLSIAREHLIDKVVLPDTFPLFTWYNTMQRHLPLNVSIRIIGILLMLFVLVLGGYRLHARKTGRSCKGICITIGSLFLAVMLLLTIITVDTAQKRSHEKRAVILEESVYILSEPADDATVLFILHEGSTVLINKDIENEWANISYFDDKIGWIRMEYLGKIES